MKFKPAYTVYFDNEEIGYIKNKDKFKKQLEEKLYDNQEENIAFSNAKEEVSYKLKFIKKEEPIEEENTLVAIINKSDITYVQYAVSVEGEEKRYFKTQEEAKKVQEELLKNFEETNIAVTEVYTKNLDIVSEEELATIGAQITNEINQKQKEERKKEEATISGIYLAINPVSGTITSRYASRESIRNHAHTGLDIATKAGTDIKAVQDGIVTFAGTKGGYGNLIIIDHGNGIETYYGHCSKIYVKEQDNVKLGEVIGAEGSTGNSTGPHLHFEIRKDGEYVNPAKYLYK